MENTSDTYKTILRPTAEILFKEKKSKFFGRAFPIQSEKQVKPIIEALRREHHTANHVCYAWQLGIAKPSYRANDDGEPNNSAGMPIYGQIQSYQVNNILVTVTRIFGGTKLGVGGLISAYRTAAQMALEEATIVERILKMQFQLSFEYPEMDRVMRSIKQRGLEIVSQQMDASCLLIVAVRKNEAEEIERLFNEMRGIAIKKILP